MLSILLSLFLLIDGVYYTSLESMSCQAIYFSAVGYLHVANSKLR